MPAPPTNRKMTNWKMFWGKAQPRAEMKNSTAETSMKRLRPIRSLIAPASPAPNMQPMSTTLTAQPSWSEWRANWRLRSRGAPATMAVSNPKRRPPMAAITVTKMTYELRLFIPSSSWNLIGPTILTKSGPSLKWDSLALFRAKNEQQVRRSLSLPICRRLLSYRPGCLLQSTRLQDKEASSRTSCRARFCHRLSLGSKDISSGPCPYLTLFEPDFPHVLDIRHALTIHFRPKGESSDHEHPKQKPVCIFYHSDF